jgi:hypothetical protein
MSEIQFFQIILEKYGIHAMAYILALFLFFKYLTKNNDRFDELVRTHEKQMSDQVDLNRKQITELVDKYNSDAESKRELYTKTLVLQMDSSKQVMETISAHNLAAHKVLSERLFSLEGRIEHIIESVKEYSKPRKLS